MLQTKMVSWWLTRYGLKNSAIQDVNINRTKELLFNNVKYVAPFCKKSIILFLRTNCYYSNIFWNTRFVYPAIIIGRNDRERKQLG